MAKEAIFALFAIFLRNLIGFSKNYGRTRRMEYVPNLKNCQLTGFLLAGGFSLRLFRSLSCYIQ